MEPAEAKVRYVIYAEVEKIYQHGDKWFVHFAGSHESVFLGNYRPDFTQGDIAKITFERISPNALPQRPPI